MKDGNGTGFAVADEVAVRLPGVHRDLYGKVASTTVDGRLTVHVTSDRGEATIDVPIACVHPWRAKGGAS